jgi:glutaredoxin 3
MIDFLQQNIFLVGLALTSGGMLLWTLVQGDAGGISAAQATLKINREDALVVDVQGSPPDRRVRQRQSFRDGLQDAEEGGLRARLQSQRRHDFLDRSRSARHHQVTGDTIMPKVLMYSTAVCPYCVRAEQLLRARGVTEIDKVRIDLEPERRDEMMQKTGRRTVPQIYIGDTHVGGCDDLYELDRQGKLVPLLAG